MTDHKPLVGIFHQNRAVSHTAAARIQRWALLLSAYSYQIEYRKGELNQNADALSRLPLPAKEASCEDLQEYVLVMEALDDSFIPSTELRRLTKVDPVLRQVLSLILKGWPTDKNKISNHLRPFYNRRDDLTVAHGLVYWGQRVVIAERARERLLKLLHDTHVGASGMKAVARTLLWYPGLDEDIEQVARRCVTCAKVASLPPSQTPQPWPETKEKWSRVHIDFAGPVDGYMLLIIVDSHSKWIEVAPLKTATAESTIQALRAIFARFGLPRTVVSDNGPQFVSAEFQDFCSRNNIQHMRTAPYFPQSNGLAERAVRTVKEGLKKLKEGNMHTRLARFLHSYRRTPGKDGKTPSQRLMGYTIRSRIDTLLPGTLPNTPDDTTNPFIPGQTVWFKNHSPGDKWLPGTVETTSGHRLVQISSPAGRRCRHADQVRPRVSNSEVQARLPQVDVTTDAAAAFPTPQQPQPVVTSEQESRESLEPAERRSRRDRRPPVRLFYRGKGVLGSDDAATE